MLWWSCCCYNVTTTAATLLMLGAKQGRDVYLAGRLLPLFLAPHKKKGTVNALIAVSMYVLVFLLLCHGQLVLMQTWFLIVMIAMDSTPAACIAAPEWFWFWFGLLVLVNIATEIALTIIAAATRHLLVLVTSSGHHNMISVHLLSITGIIDRRKFDITLPRITWPQPN